MLKINRKTRKSCKTIQKYYCDIINYLCLIKLAKLCFRMCLNFIKNM